MLLRSAGLVFLFSAVAAAASAQQTVKCESNNGNRVYCGSYRSNQVTLQRQISTTLCDRNRTWGVDNRGLWVDRGCRAIFLITSGGQYQGGPGEYPGAYPGAVPGGGWSHSRPGDTWPPSGNWNGGKWDHGGACFYKDSDFRGDYICLHRGEQRASLPDMNDRISSIRVFGGARVTVYINSNFSGQRADTAADIPNLSRWMVPGMNHSWNDRISSMRVK
jgi:hypothetical protein